MKNFVSPNKNFSEDSNRKTMRGSCRVSISQTYILLSSQKASYFCTFLYFQLLRSLTSFEAFLNPITKDPQSLDVTPSPATSLRLNHSNSSDPHWKGQSCMAIFWLEGILEITLVQPPVQHRANFKVKETTYLSLSGWILRLQRWRFLSISHFYLFFYCLLPPGSQPHSKQAVEISPWATCYFTLVLSYETFMSSTKKCQELISFWFSGMRYPCKYFSSLICACQPFSAVHQNTEPPHHSISFQRSRFSILLFGNSVLELITLDAATPFLSSCAIRVSKWCDLPATQYNLRTEAINSIDPSKGLQHVQSFYNAKVDRKS